jgi:hypothetical protein
MYSGVNTMASPIISFRLSAEAVEELRKRAKAGESENQAAQRLLNEILGTAKEQIETADIDSRIQQAIAPLAERLAALEGKSKRVA